MCCEFISSFKEKLTPQAISSDSVQSHFPQTATPGKAYIRVAPTEHIWLKLSKCSMHFTGKSGSTNGHVTWSNDLVDLFGHWLTSNSLIHWLAVNLPSRHHYSKLTLHWWTMSTYSPSKDIVSHQKYSLSKGTHSQIRAYRGQSSCIINQSATVTSPVTLLYIF